MSSEDKQNNECKEKLRMGSETWWALNTSNIYGDDDDNDEDDDGGGGVLARRKDPPKQVRKLYYLCW